MLLKEILRHGTQKDGIGITDSDEREQMRIQPIDKGRVQELKLVGIPPSRDFTLSSPTTSTRWCLRVSTHTSTSDADDSREDSSQCSIPSVDIYNGIIAHRIHCVSKPVCLGGEYFFHPLDSLLQRLDLLLVRRFT